MGIGSIGITKFKTVRKLDTTVPPLGGGTSVRLSAFFLGSGLISVPCRVWIPSGLG